MKENIIILQINVGYNIQDVKFRLKYFFGERIANKANPKEKQGYCILNIPLKSYEDIKDNLPCKRINYCPNVVRQFLNN
jgi:hypothetical protein